MSCRLYDYPPSGNGCKVRLVLRHLGLPCELVELDIRSSARSWSRSGATAPRPSRCSNAASLADIALYAYTHVAPGGGFPLEPHPAIRDWCARVAARPGHVPITSR